jgi:integrase
MIGRRASPDGLPFRLYQRAGKFKVSFGYKLASGVWAFKLSAPANQPDAVAKIRKQAIERAEELNGNAVQAGTVASLIEKYFTWQEALKPSDARRKAASTLTENQREAKNIVKYFGKMSPVAIKVKHIYAYLAERADGGAPAKANKEIALFSAILEYGRTRGELETNPCQGIKYNPTKPSQKYVEPEDLDYALAEARVRGGSYLVLALCVYTAYLTVNRPDEMRALSRTSIKADGLEIDVGKRRTGQASKRKLIEWSPILRDTITEALSLQRTSSLLIFGNTSGQIYSRSGWTTIWTRLMVHCETKAKAEGIEFVRFTLANMRPAAVTDRKKKGEINITHATGHSDERMINQVYDRRTIKRSPATK